MTRDLLLRTDLIDDDQTLERLYTALGHAEHPFFGQDEWLDALASGATKDNYWGWVGYQIEFTRRERFVGTFFPRVSRRSPSHA